ncbi:F0F1 ATP synthase subunit B [Octadecabacter sp. 1_MG-2023]|uniref:F0F1 ATP synthase subunit B n=1 Tax=unclassified Octadecabacter TaxID=196158 RepID=UPI001C087A82|nr:MULTISPECIES: F0F1 ATP synthase subunit B [unclassified Octadecabacter]MBU2994297.1 F0F1 ATP synthase subunit B [Octadecabacter sp. B2R22]MDO6734414.1 F0F1 ATP synthase subunit B [Octadecabacter sp. 1_MG-2023]
MKYSVAALLTLAASPALAASKNPFSADFWSLSNTDMIVLIAFLLFVGVLIKFKVPGMISGLLDKRAEGIKSDLDEAKALREEAQTLLASYERKQREVQEQADRIVANAKDEASRAAVTAKEEIAASVTRRLAAAEEQIESAKSSAIRDVRNQAATVAVAAAQDVIAKQTTAADANKLIDDAISEVGAKLH